jgi:alpha-D-xyloside xylohydrolase
MKFTNGFWRKRDGVSALHPAHVHGVSPGPASLTVYASTRKVERRDDTLNAPVITVSCTSPMPDVIGVRISHFLGERPSGPNFALATDPDVRARVDTTDDAAALVSGALAARFRLGGTWGLDFVAEGRVITSSGWKGMGVIDTAAGEQYIHEQLGLGVGETVYGLGERFGPLVKNGQVVDVWNADGGTSSEQAYKNVPFFLTNAGYGVFVNHPGRVSFEVASEVVSKMQFSVAGQTLEYFVIYGPTPADILRKYTALTGRPALPPAWSFGLWLSTSFTTSYDEQTVTSFVDGMAERDLPLSVFHFDTFWMREFNWCDFEWDPRAFPDPPAMLKRLKDRGLHVCVWINPYIAQQSALFTEGIAGGYLVTKGNGDVWQTDDWQAGMALVDFTNPAARAWYAGKLRALLDTGVDCFKADFGERIPTDVVYHDGSDPERMHNFYTYLYNETVFDALREHRGEGDAVVFARSATAGSQSFPVHWGGDCSSTFESMAESLRGGLSLAMSGFGYWSHDIGGFEGLPEAAVFKRWVPFGLLSSHSRLHGNQSYRVPWLFDDEAVDVLRTFTKLKHRLMPYLYRGAVTAHTDGIPMMRPLVFDFPSDPACTHLDRQYMLGDSLLVAPVFSADGDTSYYVPAGRWTRFDTGATVDGPRWVRERHGFDSVPLLVRPGAVVPVGARDDRPDYEYAYGVTLQIYELADGGSVTTSIPTITGGEECSFTVTRVGDRFSVERTGLPAPWRVLLVGRPSVASVSAGTVTSVDQGSLVDLPAAVMACEVTLGQDA